MELEEDGTCPGCGRWIPERDRLKHERGVDTQRLECPHQDLDEIAEAQASRNIADRVW